MSDRPDTGQGGLTRVRRSWAEALGVAQVLMGMALLAGEGVFTSSSYRWIFAYVDREEWGVMFVLVGVIGLAYARVPHHEAAGSIRIVWATLTAAVLSSWTLGFIAAHFTGDLIGASHVVFWSLITYWTARWELRDQ